MSRIKLEPTERKLLEVERPDGKVLFLEIRPLLVSEAEQAEKTSKEDQSLYAKGEITGVEFLFRTWAKVIKNFDRSDFEMLEFDHLSKIGEEINKLRESKKDTEKKSP